jgi:hypothetical protein
MIPIKKTWPPPIVGVARGMWIEGRREVKPAS